MSCRLGIGHQPVRMPQNCQRVEQGSQARSDQDQRGVEGYLGGREPNGVYYAYDACTARFGAKYRKTMSAIEARYGKVAAQACLYVSYASYGGLQRGQQVR